MKAQPHPVARLLTALTVGLLVGGLSWFIVRFAASDLIGPHSSMAGAGSIAYGVLSGSFAATIAFAARLAVTIKRR